MRKGEELPPPPPPFHPTQTTGSLAPSDIVDFAFTALLAKLRVNMEALSALTV